MPDDLEQLHRKVEEGLAAARELKRLKAEEQRRARPKLRLIKGGIGGAIWAGVEWLLDPRKVAVGLAAAAIGTGAAVSEEPGSPGSDPPQSIDPPTSVTPSPTTRPTVKPTVRPDPSSTSPLRTLGRSSTPVAAPTTRKTPAKTKTPQKTPTASETPSPSLTSPLTPTQSPTSLITTPTLAEATVCVVDLLGVKVCLPRG